MLLRKTNVSFGYNKLNIYFNEGVDMGGWAVVIIILLFFPIWLIFVLLRWWNWSRHLVVFKTDKIIHDTAKAFKFKADDEYFFWMPKSMVSINDGIVDFFCDEDFLITITNEKTNKKEYLNFLEFQKRFMFKK